MPRIIPSKNINAAKLLLEYYGYDSLSYFALHEKKKYFFSSTGKSFLSYAIINKVALVSGDPVGPAADIKLLLTEFNFLVKGANLSSCFVGVHEKSLPFLRSLNHKVIHAGDEAIISLAAYKKELLKKKVRRAEKHIESLGIVCEIYTRENIPSSYLRQIKNISEEWLHYKNEKQRGFSMTLGRIPGIDDKDCEFVIAVQHKKILGFLTFVPSFASQTLSLDMSRRKLQTPNGLTEFLFMKAFEYYKTKNIQQVSLNFATFYKHKGHHNYSIFKLLKNGVYKSLSTFYKTHQLYSFNEKFLPEWQSRYVVFEKRRHIPRYMLAIARAELNI
ncbi:MAG TPA: DUF2156 domain-containing protein [Patescibacteria group bacterium]|nr:DUF2156 domain-containing protein [Patescibacteria group bacterium]